jgi:Transcription termination factor nusG.
MEQNEGFMWYVMRDLKRPNAKVKAYQHLEESGFEVFTPLHWVVVVAGGKKMRRQVPVISDMLFVRSSREILDKVVALTDTLQYRFEKGKQATPITVRDSEMTAFVRACGSTPEVKYYLPEEITPSMIGNPIRIIGGTLDGLEGTLLSTRGSRKKRLLVQLPGLLAAAIEVTPAYIHPID